MNSLSALAKRLLSSGPRKTAPTARRVRATFNGKFIVDTTKATHVWEHDYYPQYYFQFSELRNCSWTEKEKISADGSTKPGASILELLIKGDGNGEGDRTTGAIHFADDSDVKELRGLLKLQFGAMGLLRDIPPSIVSSWLADRLQTRGLRRMFRYMITPKILTRGLTFFTPLGQFKSRSTASPSQSRRTAGTC